MPKAFTVSLARIAASLFQLLIRSTSVPTLRDLLTPAAQRPQVFYRGYNVYDPVNVGFISLQEQADRLGASWKYPPGGLWTEVQRVGTPYDIHWRSNGNMGHEFGVKLPQPEKDALIEYLKTL